MNREFDATTVKCAKCGALNRMRRRQFGPSRTVCGLCGAPLGPPVSGSLFGSPEQVAQGTAKQEFGFQRIAIWGGIGLVAVLAVVCLIGASRERSRTAKVESPGPQTSSPMREFTPPPAPPPPKPITHTPTRVESAPRPPRRLANGQIINRSPERGPGILTLENGTDSDVALKLVDKYRNRSLLFVYVAANSQCEVEAIPDGHYSVMYIAGEDWDDARGRFKQMKGASEFDKPANFQTTRERRGNSMVTTRTSFRVVLQPSFGGNARTETIDPNVFDKY